MPTYYAKFDYPWGESLYHKIIASSKDEAARIMTKGSKIPKGKVVFWKKKGQLPAKIAGR